MNKDLEQVIDILANSALINEKKVEVQEQERIRVLNDEINSFESEEDYSEIEDLDFEFEESKNSIDGDLNVVEAKIIHINKTMESYNERLENLIRRVQKGGRTEDRDMLDTYFSTGQIDETDLTNSTNVPLLLEISKIQKKCDLCVLEAERIKEEYVKLVKDRDTIITEHETKKTEILSKLDSKKVEEEAYKENAVFEKKKELVKLMTKEGKVSSKDVVEEIRNMISNKEDVSLIKSKMIDLASIIGYKVVDGKALVDQPEVEKLKWAESQFEAVIKNQREAIANFDVNGKSEKENDLIEKEQLEKEIEKANEKIETLNKLLGDSGISELVEKHMEKLNNIDLQLIECDEKLKLYNNDEKISDELMKSKESLKAQKQSELADLVSYNAIETAYNKKNASIIEAREEEQKLVDRLKNSIANIDSKIENDEYSNNPSKLICELKIKEAEEQVANIKKRQEFLAKCDINNVIDEFAEIYTNSFKDNEIENSKFSKKRVVLEKKADNTLAQKIREIIFDLPKAFTKAATWALLDMGVLAYMTPIAIPKFLDLINSKTTITSETQDTSKEEKKSTVEAAVDNEVKETEVSKTGLDIENSVICLKDNADEKFDLSKLMEQGKLSKSVEDSANGIYSDNVRSRDQIPEELSVLRVYKLSDEGYDLVSDIRNPKDMSKYVISVGTETADGMAVTGYISGSDLSEVMYSAENTNSITK